MEQLIVWNNPFGVDVPRTEKPGGSFAQAETVQQTFVLMKTSSRRLEDVFRLRLQKTSSRRLDQDEYIHLTDTSSEDVFKTS